MAALDIFITLIQLIFLLSVSVALLLGKVFMKGRWIYRSEGWEYWAATLTQLFALGLLLYFFGLLIP
ncbi:MULTISPECIES: hypothetical protein [Pseudoalteromonas]|uniref:DUF1656 domain-containing protein n=1 Tax=Pseudoalteromonas viridis TaxID=339617 RepID=A0ABX7V226_9GAMM|nr:MULTISPECIES: hypothetical protein [Pseudoalteromonas]MCG7535558.1 hypothetical protein [Pseudoalteromonas sp. OOF1S-7]QTL34933.1 hypothetical protein J5X90_15575 [Pseudoalteromonas viridis]